jgi:hypothetical protein
MIAPETRHQTQSLCPRLSWAGPWLPGLPGPRLRITVNPEDKQPDPERDDRWPDSGKGAAGQFTAASTADEYRWSPAAVEYCKYDANADTVVNTAFKHHQAIFEALDNKGSVSM